MIKKILLSPWTAVVTLSIIVYIALSSPIFLESVKLRYFDQLITSQPEQQTTIATVNIDEASLDKYGQWPFSRDVYGDIIKDLYDRGAGLVVWNILMSEEDRLGMDHKLQEVLREHPVVLPLVGAEETKNSPRNPGAVMIIIKSLRDSKVVAEFIVTSKDDVSTYTQTTFSDLPNTNDALTMSVSKSGDSVNEMTLIAATFTM